ncbi:MAG: LysM peptidoglycan-binding domain-containing protein, partial [Planctomycetota bacterium]
IKIAFANGATEKEKKAYQKLLSLVEKLGEKSKSLTKSKLQNSSSRKNELNKQNKKIALSSTPKEKTEKKNSHVLASPSDKTEIYYSESSGGGDLRDNPSSYSKARRFILAHPHLKRALQLAPFVASESLRKKDWLARRAALSVIYFSLPKGAKRDSIRRELDKLNRNLLFGKASSPLWKIHIVRKGDTLSRIAGKYNVPWEFLLKLNGLNRPIIRIGQRLKVIGGKWEIRVKKSEFRLVILLNGFYMKEYTVGLGKNGSTPTGEFIIVTKQKNPTWYWKGRRYPYGHPKNILGPRWLGFKNTEKYSGYGIHGTSFPDSIGKEASSGCIRMRNEEVKELYSMIPRKTKVFIED